MKTKKILIILTLFLGGFSVNSQTSAEFEPSIMYVNARAGLRVRSEPNINSMILGTFQYGRIVIAIERSYNSATINGISNYWYRLWYWTGRENKIGWIFGGYLSEELPEDIPVVIGIWDDINNPRQYYRYNIDNNYSEGYKGTGIGMFGTWQLNGNVIQLHFNRAMGDIELDEYTNLRIIDRNNIEISYENEIRRLRRNRSGEGWY